MTVGFLGKIVMPENKKARYLYKKQWAANNRERVRQTRIKWVSENMERVRQYGRDWARKHPNHRKPSVIAYMKEYNKINRDKLNSMKREIYKANRENYLLAARERSWKKKGINMTVSDYKTKLIQQDSKCKICERHSSELKKALAVDHDHVTGQTRDLLCLECNWFIVRVLEKYGDLILKGQNYLEDWKKK